MSRQPKILKSQNPKILVPEKHQLPILRDVAISSYRTTFAPFNTHENMEAFLSESYSLTQFEKELEEPGSQYYLAMDENVAVGFARLRLNDEVDKELGKNTIELQRLYVHPDHQGKKIGFRLMEKSMEYASEHHFDWIWLGVWERNFKAQKFYAAWGFEKFGEHIFQMGDDPQTDWLLRKKLK